MKLVKKGIWLVVLIFLVGCSYTFNLGTFGKYESIYIPLGENETSQLGIEEDLNELLEKKLRSKYDLEFENSEDESELTIYTTAKSFESEALSFNEENVVEEYLVKIECHFLMKAKNNKVIVDKQFVGEGIYKSENATQEEGKEKAVENCISHFLNEVENQW